MVILPKEYIGAYWGNREESARDCARRVLDVLRCLGGCDELFQTWLHGADALHLDEETILGAIMQAYARKTAYEPRIPELGVELYSFRTNDDWLTSAAVSFLCGCYASTPAVSIPNSCIVELPDEGAAASRIRAISTAIAMVECVVRAWSPDWAVLSSRAYRNNVTRVTEDAPFVSWVTYLSVPVQILPPLPAPARAFSSESNGTMIVLTDEHFDTDNVTHMHTANQVRDILNREHLLNPIRYY